MPTVEKTVTVRDRSFTICGDAEDPYFANAEAILSAEAPFEAWARNHLPADGVVIDAGGNIGLTALLLSALVPDGTVLVFEPLDGNLRHLRRNLERNGIGNCIVAATALGDVAGTISMHGTGASAHVAPTGHAGIQITTLDAYVDRAGLSRVDLIKMDVEGSEPAVLAGASRLIKRFAPPIFMEFNSWCLSYVQDFDARLFAQHLWAGFDVLSLNENGTERPAGGGDIDRFLHDNLVLHGTVEDVLLRFRKQADLRDLARNTSRGSLIQQRDELQRLHAALHAMHRSTSWRITAPLRALARAVGARPS